MPMPKWAVEAARTILHDPKFNNCTVVAPNTDVVIGYVPNPPPIRHDGLPPVSALPIEPEPDPPYRITLTADPHESILWVTVNQSRGAVLYTWRGRHTICHHLIYASGAPGDAAAIALAQHQAERTMVAWRLHHKTGLSFVVLCMLVASGAQPRQIIMAIGLADWLRNQAGGNEAARRRVASIGAMPTKEAREALAQHGISRLDDAGFRRVLYATQTILTHA